MEAPPQGGSTNVAPMGKEMVQNLLVLVLGNTVKETTLSLNPKRTVGHPECYQEQNWFQQGR